jgi:hypothetical protein
MMSCRPITPTIIGSQNNVGKYGGETYSFKYRSNYHANRGT